MRMKGVVEPLGHVMIRRVGVAVLAITFAISGARAFPQKGATQAAARAEDLSSILDAWVQDSSRIKALAAKFSRKDSRRRNAFMDLVYDIRWKDSGQAVLNIEPSVRKSESGFEARIFWTGRDVWQYNPRRKEIIIWTKDGLGEYAEFRRSIQESWWGRFMGNTFEFIFPALGDPKEIDPLPFLIEMKGIMAKRQFRFELLENSDDDRFVLRATPLDPVLKSSYDHVIVTLDRERHLPIVVEYQRGWRGNDRRRYTLLSIEVDRPIDDASLVPRKLKGWTVTSR
jgi:hypothetical protein